MTRAGTIIHDVGAKPGVMLGYAGQMLWKLAVVEVQTQVPRHLCQLRTLLGGSSRARLVEMAGGFEFKPGVARGHVLRRRPKFPMKMDLF